MGELRERPVPYALPPEGFHFEPVSSEGWVTPALSDGRCRYGAGWKHKACGRPAVASLKRGRSWWNYCEDHLYGRWIEDGEIVHWRLVRDAA